MKSINLEIRDLILEFEKQCNPFKYQVEGFCIWPIFRFIAFENLKISKGESTSRPKNNFFYYIQSLSIILKDTAKLIKLRLNKEKVNFLAFTNSATLRDKFNTSYKNTCFDFFEPPLENIVYWYNITFNIDRLNRYSPLFITDRFMIVGYIIWRYKYKNYIKTICSLYTDFTNYLESKGYRHYFSVEMSTWLKKLKYFVVRKKLIENLIKLLKPKLLLIDCAYDGANIAAVAAGKSANIPVWELQHGVIYDGHMGYTYDGDLAGKYKANLPLPDKILTFGRYYSKILMERGFWHELDVPPVGFPRLEYFKKRYPEKYSYNNGNLKVLISSQWILVDEIVFYLSQVLPDLPEYIHIKVKPHPLESDEEIKKYETLGSRIEIIDKNAGFYNALFGCHIHCAVFSTTLFESIGMGIPTLIINLPGAEHVSSIVEAGGAKIANTPSDFIEILKKSMLEKNYLKEWQDETIKNQSFFWESEPDKNIRNLFLKAIDR